MKKRQFIKDVLLTTLAAPIGLTGLANTFKKNASLPAKELAMVEDFWLSIRNQYLLKPDYINLENGYYNFLPQPILDKYIEHIKSIDLVISGFDWQKGDEAIMAIQDYGSMLDMFEQVKNRYGIVNVKVSIPNHPTNDEEIVAIYEKAITSKTKLMMVSHMINITGHILPIKKICAMAHAKGVQVIVDGAHAFAHFQYSIDDLGCDYYAASLHKWLSSPLGAGILYINKNRIKNLWPLLADGEKQLDKIKRLNHIGTHPVATDLAINDSIDYYEMIGAEKKEARLRYLQNYWTSKVRNNPKIIINTPTDQTKCCGIANVGIVGIKPSEVATRLMNEFKIFTVAIDYANVIGCRICPNVYTTTDELDQFVNALNTLAKNV